MMQKQNFGGYNFQARDYQVLTVGMDEGLIREYIKKQVHEDKRLDQLRIFEQGKPLLGGKRVFTALSGSQFTQTTGFAGDHDIQVECMSIYFTHVLYGIVL